MAGKGGKHEEAVHTIQIRAKGGERREHSLGSLDEEKRHELKEIQGRKRQTTANRSKNGDKTRERNIMQSRQQQKLNLSNKTSLPTIQEKWMDRKKFDCSDRHPEKAHIPLPRFGRHHVYFTPDETHLDKTKRAKIK
ncbi:hypothetical protein RUM44_004596 [Polyplax serrata]|uniref:Uncharacterized protein n=1 Tax=Polyplax serrata TaxID=468196 RepID=A0ABR1B3B4_POLSC